nr:MAG TPA: hypothetical protein [Bacteriophage sp.]
MIEAYIAKSFSSIILLTPVSSNLAEAIIEFALFLPNNNLAPAF